MLPSTELWKQDAIRKLSASCSISLDDAPQHVISEELKATSFQALSDSLSTLPGGNHRLLAVCAQKLPAGDPKSDICPGSGGTESDNHRHRPTGLLALLCPFELSNAAFITSSALLLGTCCARRHDPLLVAGGGLAAWSGGAGGQTGAVHPRRTLPAPRCDLHLRRRHAARCCLAWQPLGAPRPLADWSMTREAYYHQ